MSPQQRREFGLLLCCIGSLGLQLGIGLAFYRLGWDLAVLPFIASIWFSGWATVIYSRWYADQWHHHE